MKTEKQEDRRRVFFGLEAIAPWPQTLPEGRIIQEPHRHATLVFLGNCAYTELLKALKNLPLPPLKVGIVAKFDSCLFLPKSHHPNVATWHVEWFDNPAAIITFQESLQEYLKKLKFLPDSPQKPWLPHVSICRNPVDITAWKRAFSPLPVIFHNICLYESLGHSQYVVRWQYPLKEPFREIEHTADIAYLIHGEDLSQIHMHAQVALSFREPRMLPYLAPYTHYTTLDDVVISLNDLISRMDSKEGSPFKAVSFYGSALKENDQTLTWEMIVDV